MHRPSVAALIVKAMKVLNVETMKVPALSTVHGRQPQVMAALLSLPHTTAALLSLLT